MEHNDIISMKASEYNVTSDIHEEDFIFKFLIENPCFSCADDAINYYFMDGEISAKKLSRYISEIYGKANNLQLLEFASGYGCVTRHFKNVLKGIDTTSCDIHGQAVDFIKYNLGEPSIISNSTPELFIGDKEYDISFALSFFSHMPKSTWGRWLAALAENTKENGCIIFTTQGYESMKYFGDPVLDSEGFWFKSESEQKDLDTGEYGQTIVSPDYVFNIINELKNMDLILYKKSGWWEHQDIYIVRMK